ncbi:MAG: CHAD domain-containing protein, partial [Thiohalobacterales bacterium]|nr:CHAD domain-containing protein [Thiohalobacterales bacterium]
IRVEIEYFIALCELPLPQLAGFDVSKFGALRSMYSEFGLEDAEEAKATQPTLAAAIRDVYRRGRKLHKLLTRNPDTEYSHGLHSQAAYLWYQLRLLGKQLPGEGEALIAELGQLCELLGDDNDMAALIDNLGGRPGLCCNRVQAELLCSLAETRRISLLSAALRISERIYARKSAEFIGELFPAP